MRHPPGEGDWAVRSTNMAMNRDQAWRCEFGISRLSDAMLSSVWSCRQRAIWQTIETLAWVTSSPFQCYAQHSLEIPKVCVFPEPGSQQSHCWGTTQKETETDSHHAKFWNPIYPEFIHDSQVWLVTLPDQSQLELTRLTVTLFIVCLSHEQACSLQAGPCPRPGPDFPVPSRAQRTLKDSPWMKGREWRKVFRDKDSKTVTSVSLTSRGELEKLLELNKSKILRHLPRNFPPQLITQRAPMSLLIWSTVKLSTFMVMILSHQEEAEICSVTRFKMARNMKYVYKNYFNKIQLRWVLWTWIFCSQDNPTSHGNWKLYHPLMPSVQMRQHRPILHKQLSSAYCSQFSLVMST